MFRLMKERITNQSSGPFNWSYLLDSWLIWKAKCILCNPLIFFCLGKFDMGRKGKKIANANKGWLSELYCYKRMKAFISNTKTPFLQLWQPLNSKQNPK